MRLMKSRKSLAKVENEDVWAAGLSTAVIIGMMYFPGI